MRRCLPSHATSLCRVLPDLRFNITKKGQLLQTQQMDTRTSTTTPPQACQHEHPTSDPTTNYQMLHNKREVVTYLGLNITPSQLEVLFHLRSIHADDDFVAQILSSTSFRALHLVAWVWGIYWSIRPALWIETIKNNRKWSYHVNYTIVFVGDKLTAKSYRFRWFLDISVTFTHSRMTSVMYTQKCCKNRMRCSKRNGWRLVLARQKLCTK